MTGFVITDAAAKMAQRLEVLYLTQSQADAMRRRVAELEAEVMTEAAILGIGFRSAARRRLARVVAERLGWFQTQHAQHTTELRVIAGRETVPASEAGESCSP